MPPEADTPQQYSLAESHQAESGAEERRPWVVTFERAVVPGETTLLDVCETYEDVLSRYGCIHLKGFVIKVMGEKAVASYSPEALWSVWEGARTESVRASFPLTFETDLPIKTWRKRNARAVRSSLPPEVLASPIACYWRTVNASLASCMPGLTADLEGPVIPESYKPTYGMIMERHSGETADRYAQLDSDYPAHWCMHHADFGGIKNRLHHHPALEAHKLLGIASPNSYYYGGSFASSFQHHWEDFFMPSVNFLYQGAEKHWVSASASDTRAVWEVIKAVGKAVKLKPDEKKFLLSPELLWSLAFIHTYPVHQMPGDAVVSAAGATHGGLNLGMNFAEAVNFADESWAAMAGDMLDFYAERDRGVPGCVLEIAGLQP